MVELFLCCSPDDLDTAAVVAARLEHTAEVTVVIDDSTTGSVAARWEGGLSSAAILLLLSPHAVPSRVSRTEWEAVLNHITSNAEPPIGFLFIAECGYPRLLERKRFFRWDEGSRAALRRIEEWVMRLHRLPERRSFVPARLPWFEGRQRELATLWEKLVDGAGTAVIYHSGAGGKTSLAQDFARQAGGHFRDILWMDCGDRSPVSIAGDLAEGLGIACEAGSEEDLKRLADVVGQHRVLLVFDDLRPGFDFVVGPEGRASVLITTRWEQGGAIQIDDAPPVELDIPEDPVTVRLWQAMAVCRPSGFPVELAAEIAEVEPGDVAAACARLIQGRLVDPFDQAAGRLRMSAASVAVAGGSLEAQRRRHADVVHAAIHPRTSHPDKARQYIPEVMPAFRWATKADWNLAGKLARQGYTYFRNHGRLAEGVELLIALRNAAELREDWQVSDECDWELSWVRNTPYRGADRGPVEGDQLSFSF
ncbi:MAG TPA: TIR domain-containing protein [Bryobacteraceae bacterium]|nr:TIR domain-containing protein [Bryobacteraceae bacterium]